MQNLFSPSKMPAAEEFCVNKKLAKSESGAQTPMSTISGTGGGTPMDGEWKLVSGKREIPIKCFYLLSGAFLRLVLQIGGDGQQTFSANVEWRVRFVGSWEAKEENPSPIWSLILGFCGKEEAEHLLAQCQRPTLLIRFSDIEFAKVKISVRDQFGGGREDWMIKWNFLISVIRHHWYEQSELQGRSLGQVIEEDGKWRQMGIYVDRNANKILNNSFRNCSKMQNTEKSSLSGPRQTCKRLTDNKIEYL
jgi:hypothetical protein